MLDHGCAGDGPEVLAWVGGRGPVWAAVPVARVLVKEGTDAVRAKIGNSVSAGSGYDDGVRQDDFVLVDATLEVTQDKVPTGNVVAEVAQGLHDQGPFPSLVAPPGVAVKLLIVLDKRLDQGPLASPAVSTIVIELPYLRHVYLDCFIDYVQLIELVDNVQGLVHSLDIEAEVILLEDGARLEPLANAGLVTASTLGIFPLCNPPKSTRSKGVIESTMFKGTSTRVVVTAAVRLLCGWAVGMVAVHATCASRHAGRLGILVGGVR